MKTILTINCGSSSLKASLFRDDGSRQNFRYEHIGNSPRSNHAEAFEKLLADLGNERPKAIGHRVVHGGEVSATARHLDDTEISRLKALTHLAPLHLPANLLGIALGAENFGVPQFACFDTAFHATLPEIAWRLPIPAALGYRRFGFHGINYAHVSRKLPELIGATALGKVVIAHLGSGASLCLLDQLKSVETTMGYTPAGGIPMGTRSGDLDPGIMLELAKRFDINSLSEMVYYHMGLLALSGGVSAEMSELLNSETSSAQFAVRYFVRHVVATIGSYAAIAGGIDALVFTGGIGEHAPDIRAAICDPLALLGIKLDDNANQRHLTLISAANSIPVLIVPADEEREICRLTLEQMDGMNNAHE
ncbi:MAG: acetate kinase [Gallionella sp.]|nr:acetate kinase [Gallionella sp.]